MKVHITTAFFEILATLEIKQPKQKKKRSTPQKQKPMQKSSISKTINIITQN